MNTLLAGLENKQNQTRTENGALAFKSTKSKLLDMFASMGAMRSSSEKEIINMFTEAFNEDRLLAMKCLFYIRDVRGGQGEKRVFLTVAKWLAYTHPNALIPNLQWFGEFGKYKDLMPLLDTPVSRDVVKVIKAQLEIDLNAENPSLLAKWLPSESSKAGKDTKRHARKIQKALGISPKEYRKMLTSLRKRLNLVETKMCEQKWSEIEYDRIPSRCGMLNKNAFMRNDEMRYRQFIEDLSKGEKTINSSTLYPYEIAKRVEQVGLYGTSDEAKLYDGMWNNLPNYMGDSEESIMMVADVSASMTWTDNAIAYYSALALSVYGAERSKGAFKNKFMTFSTTPQLVSLDNAPTIRDKMRRVMQSRGMGGTNLMALFDLILDTAKANNVPQSDLPSRMFILTDGHFDKGNGHHFRGSKAKSILQEAQAKFRQAGYECPKVVFWILDKRGEMQPITIDDSGVQIVSGQSPSTFTSLMANQYTSPIDLMLEVIDSPRYSVISIDE